MIRFQPELKLHSAKIQIPAIMVVLVIGLVTIGFFIFQAKKQAELQRLGLDDPEAKKHLVTEPMTKKLRSSNRNRPLNLN